MKKKSSSGKNRDFLLVTESFHPDKSQKEEMCPVYRVLFPVEKIFGIYIIILEFSFPIIFFITSFTQIMINQIS